MTWLNLLWREVGISWMDVPEWEPHPLDAQEFAHLHESSDQAAYSRLWAIKVDDMFAEQKGLFAEYQKFERELRQSTEINFDDPRIRKWVPSEVEYNHNYLQAAISLRSLVSQC